MLAMVTVGELEGLGETSRSKLGTRIPPLVIHFKRQCTTTLLSKGGPSIVSPNATGTEKFEHHMALSLRDSQSLGIVEDAAYRKSLQQWYEVC